VPKEDYNPAEFRIPARGSNQRSSRLSFRIQKEQARTARAIVQSKRFPYRAEAEFYRHAIGGHIQWLTTLEDVASMVAQYQMRLDAGRLQMASASSGKTPTELPKRRAGEIPS